MDCAVYDTYVEKKDGKVMHFDVIVETVHLTKGRLSMAKTIWKVLAKEVKP